MRRFLPRAIRAFRRPRVPAAPEPVPPTMVGFDDPGPGSAPAGASVSAAGRVNESLVEEAITSSGTSNGADSSHSSSRTERSPWIVAGRLYLRNGRSTDPDVSVSTDGGAGSHHSSFVSVTSTPRRCPAGIFQSLP